MPTLLEQTKAAIPPIKPLKPLEPADVLRARHRWARWRGVLLAGAIGLAVTLLALWATHPSAHSPSSWKLPATIWGGGVLLTLIGAALGWRFAPASLLDTAQTIDRRHTTKNRLEATASFEDSTSALAKAQREETAEFLKRTDSRVRPPLIMPWLMGAILLLLVSHLLTLGLWTIPDMMKPTPPIPLPPAKELPKAKITWKSPEPETKANPIEEVPATAQVESETGLKNMTLEMSVNGAPKKSQPIPTSPYDKAGKNTLKVSMYMDELQVEPYDVVSYYLRGVRVANGTVPDTTSPIQFIQVRPMRDDVAQQKGGGPPPNNKNFNYMVMLKLAQLRAVKENFILAHSDLPVTNPVRMRENERVGKNQGELAAKTEEVVQAYTQDGLPEEIIDLLIKAEDPMKDASKKILATQNKEALPPQQKALGYIIEIEKYFHKVMNDSQSSAPPDNAPPDPFKDKQKHELKKRDKAAAGQLEALAKNQAKVSKELNDPSPGQGGSAGTPDQPTPDKPAPDAGKKGENAPAPAEPAPGSPAPGTPAPSPSGSKPDSGTKPDNGKSGDDGKTDGHQPASQSVDPFGPNADKGSLAEQQTRVVQGISTLLNGNQQFPNGVNEALQNAQKAATESMASLNKGDNAGAQEPAATASRELQKALGAMNNSGEQDTKQAMADAQQKLNDLAKQLSDLSKNASAGDQKQAGNFSKQTGDIRKELENQADKQQETGSAAGAQQLQSLAKEIAKQDIEKDLDGMSKNGLDAKKLEGDAQRMEDLAGKASQGSVAGKPTAQDYAKLINALEKSRANLQRLAEKANGAGDKPGTQPMPEDTGKEKSPNGQGDKPGDQAGQAPDPNGKNGPGDKPGQEPGTGPGEKPAMALVPGQQPGDQPGKEAGTQPGDQGQGDKEGKGSGTKPGDKPGPGQQTAQQGQGGGQGQQPGQDGQGQTTDPNAKGEGQGQANATAQGTGGSDPNGKNGGGQQGGLTNTGGYGRASVNDNVPPNSNMGDAYHDVMAELRDEAQTSQTVLPNSGTAAALRQEIAKIQKDPHYRDVNPHNVVTGYNSVGKPLDGLLVELQEAIARTQRDQVVKEPNLDDAPAAYRSAVSDYFEAMSKDYHPDDGTKPKSDDGEDKTKTP